MARKILFVGAGAIGSYLGAFLSRAGHDVTLVDPWAEQVETIRQRGISVTGPHEPFEARPAAVHLNEAARLPRDYDVAFVAMKVYDTAWAAQLALRHLAPDGYVVAAENCWPDPVLASGVGARRAGARPPRPQVQRRGGRAVGGRRSARDLRGARPDAHARRRDTPQLAGVDGAGRGQGPPDGDRLHERPRGGRGPPQRRADAGFGRHG